MLPRADPAPQKIHNIKLGRLQFWFLISNLKFIQFLSWNKCLINVSKTEHLYSKKSNTNLLDIIKRTQMISYAHKCVHIRGVRNVSFSENFRYVLNEWSRYGVWGLPRWEPLTMVPDGTKRVIAVFPPMIPQKQFIIIIRGCYNMTRYSLCYRDI